MIWTNKSFSRGNFQGHRHDMHEFFVCLNDLGVQYVEGRKCESSRGRAFFIYSGLHHSLESDAEIGVEYIFFCFDPGYFLSREMPEVNEQIQRLKSNRQYFSGMDPDYLAENVRIARELHHEINHPAMLSDNKITALLTCLIVNFSRSLTTDASDEAESESSTLAILCRKIRKKPEDVYRMTEAAEAAAMSRSKFAVKFKEHTGMTFMEYIIEFRLKYACRLLSDKDMSVLEAATQSGFSNVGHFHRQFKKRFGITPLQMKKKYAAASFPAILKVL